MKMLIERFSFCERLVHWLSAFSFVYTGLTGLALWSPSLYWIALVFGGGVRIREWHPWAGIVFAIVLAIMSWSWARQMFLDSCDLKWLSQSREYLTHESKEMPESGRFNAGQKVLFWLQISATTLLLGSGLILWWPQTMPRVLLLASIVIHPVAAIISLTAIVVHIYMGTIGVPGSFKGMVRGWVPESWAMSHHSRWYRENSKN